MYKRLFLNTGTKQERRISLLPSQKITRKNCIYINKFLFLVYRKNIIRMSIYNKNKLNFLLERNLYLTQKQKIKIFS